MPGSKKTRGRSSGRPSRSEEHTSELQSPCNLVCRLLLEKKNTQRNREDSLLLRSPGACSSGVGHVARLPGLCERIRQPQNRYSLSHVLCLASHLGHQSSD